jgi:cation-transporting P-type ATPase 13A2
VFDKTGTLTEEGLSVLGFRGVDTAYDGSVTFCPFTATANKISADTNSWWLFEDPQSYRNKLPTLFLEALATCTAITYVGEELVGDPLDVKMFESTGWVLDESNTSQTGATLGED